VLILINSVLIIGGLFNLGFAVFHCFFWKAFDWKKELAAISKLNRNVVQILNLCLILVLAAFGAISLVFYPDLLRTNLGMVMLLVMALFWLFRGIEQIIFFGLKNGQSIVFTILFFFGFLLYTMPLLLAMYLIVAV
jgi:hypothetical protein